jgi:hypothetical protein
MHMPETAFRESIGLLLTRRCGTFWFASLLSNIGTWAQQVAQPWLLLSLGAFGSGRARFLCHERAGVGVDARGRRPSRPRRSPPCHYGVPVRADAVPDADRRAAARRRGAALDDNRALAVGGITDALSMPSFSSIIPSIVEREWCKPLHRDNCAVRRLASTCLRCVVAAHGGALRLVSP